ncbi:MAG: hypothetical protein H8D46_02335 [FCB group bacterium]|nr:hypothetical protein [FCB group bacterium]
MNKESTELYPQANPGGGASSLAHKRAKRALWAELISGVTGIILSGFIFGHLILESTALFGVDFYNEVAHFMEHTLPLAQISAFVVPFLFFIHFVYAGRKIPGKLYERKRMLELGKSLKKSKRLWNQKPGQYTTLKRHFETSLWIWQVRTGMIVLALGAFHLVLAVWNIFTNMGYAAGPGLNAAVSMPRVSSGLWLLYLFLGISIVSHMSIGLYRFAVKWFADSWFNRKMAYIVFTIVFWFYLILNIAGVLALAGVLEGVLS